MATVTVSAALRRLTQQQSLIVVEGNTLQAVLTNLIAKHPKLKPYLFTNENEPASFVSIYLNDKDTRHLPREKIPIATNDTVTIIPAIAGG